MAINNAVKTIEWLLVEDLSSLKEYFDEWQQLVIETESNLFCSPEWIMPWIDTYWLSSWHLKTIMGFKNQKLIAIIPLYTQKTNSFFSFTKLLPLGQGEPEESEISSEYQDVIIHNKFNNESTHVEIANKILTINYDQIICHSLLANSNWSKILLHIDTISSHKAGSRYLLDEKNNFIQNLSKNNAVKWRRCQKKLNSLDAEYIWVDVNNYQFFWKKLILFHQKRWATKGELGAFFHQDFLKFHTLLQERSTTKMSAILINGVPIVINYYLQDNDTLYFYQCGWNENEYAALSPGFSLHIWSIINNPLKSYDFMMSHAKNSYKKAFNCSTIQNMYDIKMFKNSFINFMYNRLKGKS